MAKLQPVPLNLRFEFSGGVNFIDLSQCCSIVSRKFLRQGLQWAVAGFTVFAGTGTTASFTISKIPQTWVASNAWHKAYAHWKKQQDDAIEESGSESAVAKYRDFKIHATTDHVDSGFALNEIPLDGAKNPFQTGEWQASQIVLPNVVPDASGSTVDPQEYFLHMVGDNNHGGLSRGVIDGYASSRAYPQSPDPVSPNIASNTNWLMQMDDVGKDSPEIVANATDSNDELPYDQVDYPGGAVNAPTLELVHQSFLNATTFHRVRQLSGCMVPCGLLEVNFLENDGPVSLIVHLVPGDHRGYLAAPMQDM